MCTISKIGINSGMAALIPLIWEVTLISKYWGCLRIIPLRYHITHSHVCFSMGSGLIEQYYAAISGFPGGTSGKEPTCQCRRHKKCRFDPWVRKSLWRRKWLATPVFSPGKSHGQRSLAGYSPWGLTESDTTEYTHPLPWDSLQDPLSSLKLKTLNWISTLLVFSEISKLPSASSHISNIKSWHFCLRNGS